MPLNPPRGKPLGIFTVRIKKSVYSSRDSRSMVRFIDLSNA